MARLKVAGSLLKVGDGASPEVFTTIGQVVGVTGLGSGSAREIDVTDFASTSKEFVLGLPDQGSAQITIVWDPKNAQHISLEADRVAQTVRNFTLTATDSPASIISFAGSIATYGRDAESDDVYRATISARLNSFSVA